MTVRFIIFANIMIAENILRLQQEIGQNVQLVIVSKYRTIEAIREAYDTGHREFAENRVQALLERAELLPDDIRWHLIGHLQSNKVKYIIPFIHMIQSVDSLKLLIEINEQAKKNSTGIDCLLQIDIADEETKFGLTEQACLDLLDSKEFKLMRNIKIRGLMGMATNTEDMEKVKREFSGLKAFFERLKTDYKLKDFDTLSMGMSGDYAAAVACGSNMIRVGSKVFGDAGA
jgi:pyridoxal phosphate enzyme (YggS family)